MTDLFLKGLILPKVGQWSEEGGLETSSEDLFPDSKGDIVLRAVVVMVSACGYCCLDNGIMS